MFIGHIFNNKNYFKIFHCKFQTKNKSDINGLISNYLYILWWIIHTYFDIFIPCWLHLATFFTYQFVNHVIIIQMQASLKSDFADMNCRNDFYFTYPVSYGILNPMVNWTQGRFTSMVYWTPLLKTEPPLNGKLNPHGILTPPFLIKRYAGRSRYHV